MIQEIDTSAVSSDEKPMSGKKRVPTPAPKRASPHTGNNTASASSTTAAYEKRFSDLEARMTTYEGRLNDTEKRLTSRIDEGFSQVLSQLQSLQAPALPSQGSKRQDAPQSTPHKGGPRKDARLET